jgi:peptidoglycan/xylan/chitin deacetylase (PgdA/CDA1 family)
MGTSGQAPNARFILSFDCEGKWGMADDPGMIEDDQINSRSLQNAYSQILDILEKHQVPATFALVGLFAGTREIFHESKNQLLESEPHREWLRIPEQAFAQGKTDGWFYPEVIQHIQSKGMHEISSHSYSHMPMHNEGVTEDSFLLELKCVERWKASNSVASRTYIFPRNQIKHKELLSDFGYSGYRECDVQNSAYANRFKILQDECNILRKSDSHSIASRPIAIPPGTFLNWRHGPRRVIPRLVTEKRWANVLGDAEKSGGVAHLWLHPHNLITARGQVDLFESAIARVGKLQKEQRLKAVTQESYCQEILANQ